MCKFFWLKLIAITGLIGSVLSFFMGQEKGKDDAMVQSEMSVIKSIEIANKIERDNAHLTRSDVDKRLRDKNNSGL